MAYFRSSEAASEGMKVGETLEDADIDTLINDCKTAYAALQDAAQRTQRRMMSGAVAINATGVLQAIGIRREPGRRIRHYLRLLGLAVSLMETEGTDRALWWWKISDRPLDEAKLVKFATGKNAYRSRKASQDDPLNGPVTVSHVKVGASSRVVPNPSVFDTRPLEKAVAPTVPVSTANDTVTALVSIIEDLENQLIKEKSARHQDTISHQKEITELQERITELEAEKVSSSVSDPRVDAILTRHNRKD